MTNKESELVACGLCGKPATGFAEIAGTRYCHGDSDSEPTCYMKSQIKYVDVPTVDLADLLRTLHDEVLDLGRRMDEAEEEIKKLHIYNDQLPF